MISWRMVFHQTYDATSLVTRLRWDMSHVIYQIARSSLLNLGKLLEYRYSYILASVKMRRL